MTCYRSCNFCGSTTFRVFRRAEAPFPAKIFGDRDLTDPSVGQYLKLQYLECTNCGLVCINPVTTFADINPRTYDGERNLPGWSRLDYQTYEESRRAAMEGAKAIDEAARHRSVMEEGVVHEQAVRRDARGPDGQRKS